MVILSRPASEAELERWLMYWSVLGCIVAVEYVAEWLISWLPFYYPLKTFFLLYLALPQTAGASYLYKTQVQPFFSSHESEIDSALSQLKTYVYNYLQQLLRSAWNHVSSTLGQNGDRIDALDEGGITREAAANAGAPPSIGDPVSGPIQLAQTLWRSYGPSIIVGGATVVQYAQNAANIRPAPSRDNSSQSALERRRQLEAELASLKASESTIRPYNVGDTPPSPPVLIPSAANHSRTSSESSSSRRERPGSGNGKSTFEEVEVPSDLEGESHHIQQRSSDARRSSWFGWGGSQGYERVKTD
ncbi:unnamed protein product [Somion occarium]|uniref:Protein YOP1 n=1 Tax=Somion occarium TaxID=3059160 RepID=A0ABP1DSK0_9APHY